LRVSCGENGEGIVRIIGGEFVVEESANVRFNRTKAKFRLNAWIACFEALTADGLIAGKLANFLVSVVWAALIVGWVTLEVLVSTGNACRFGLTASTELSEVSARFSNFNEAAIGVAWVA
jgi:hypothetical protein